MSFFRIKTITKGGRSYSYRYRQTSVREGKRVRSIMEYLGPVTGHRPGIACAERTAKEMNAYQRATFGETADERAARDSKGGQFNQEAFLEEGQEAEKSDTTDKGESKEES
jgi:hypothetical protein